MEAEFKINDYQDRTAIVYGLANAGYKVWIERTKPVSRLSSGDYYVCVEMPEKERKEISNGCGFDEQSV